MNSAPNLPDPDAIYDALIQAHEGLSLQQSCELNTRLVLLLANQIGDQALILHCLQAAAIPFKAKVTPS